MDFLAFFKQILKKTIPQSYVLYRGNREGGKVALTFDDGPHPHHTRKILDILKKEGVKATFFLVGDNVEKFPHLVEEIVEDGHEVGNHSFSHARLAKMPWGRMAEEIEKTDSAVNRFAGVWPKLFRPPYGSLSLRLLSYVILKKRTLVLWSVDSGDSYCDSPVVLQKHLIQKDVSSGAIILLHEDMEQTVEAISGLISYIRARGLGFATVSEIVGTVLK